MSVAARELCCRVTVTGPSFRKSAENLGRLGQIRVSSNRLRQIVEDEGQRALKARDKGLIGPSWDALDCKTNANDPTRVMVGADGVMVPLVTQSEKQKRRKNRRTRREATLRSLAVATGETESLIAAAAIVAPVVARNFLRPKRLLFFISCSSHFCIINPVFLSEFPKLT